MFQLILTTLILFATTCDALNRSFIVDWENDRFLKDGEPFQYISGSIHYFRVPPAYWPDRLKKLKAAGFEAVQTYIEWNSHEIEPGSFVIKDQDNFVEFIKEAQRQDLLVIIRPGPYICAERDNGGLPYWLLRIDPNIKVRTSDPTFMKYSLRWYDFVLERLRPLFYSNGGPIILLQIENEYGSFPACDKNYTLSLRDHVRKSVGNEITLFTTDGNTEPAIKCGMIDDVLATIDFGTTSDVDQSYKTLRKLQKNGPLVNSEFYPGWLDHWSLPHETVAINPIINSFKRMLYLNISVNFYVLHGGTSFGLKAGANIGDEYLATPTSYDYDAPLTEAGDPTEKYFVLKDIIEKHFNIKPKVFPSGLLEITKKMNVGEVPLRIHRTLLSIINDKAEIRSQSKQPQTFAQLSVSNGFVLYKTKIPFITQDPSILYTPDIKDRGQVYVDGVYQGVISRTGNVLQIPLTVRLNSEISILVENQGGVCFGAFVAQSKGLGRVSLGLKVLENWSHESFHDWENSSHFISQEPAESLISLSMASIDTNMSVRGGAVYRGNFVIENGVTFADTYLDVGKFIKGMVFINDFCLGRYWPLVGPQKTLYVPKTILKPNPEKNEITLLELEGSESGPDSREYMVKFIDIPTIDSPTPIN